jgi:hypothetical protein
LAAQDELAFGLQNVSTLRANPFQNYDIIACRRLDGGYDLKQLMVGGHLILLREGPFDRASAAAAALELAEREQSDAWIQEGAKSFRCLNDR